MKEPVLIGLDWGTSSVRAYAFSATGEILASVADPSDQAMGVQTFKLRLGREPTSDDFAAALKMLLNGLAAKLSPKAATLNLLIPILASGMIGSKQGLKDAGYAACPTNPSVLANLLVGANCGPYLMRLVPGLRLPKAANGLPDFMRGEETQVLGQLVGGEAEGLFVLPGSHSKWVDVREGSITKFETHFSGELFAVLKEHSILGRLFEPASQAKSRSGGQEAFERGLQIASEHPQNLLQHLFSTRALGLDEQLSEAGGEHFLSGLLIGHEISSALTSRPGTSEVTLIGSTELCERYALALQCFNITSTSSGNTSAQGLWRLAQAAHLI
jgi:2-dehydro-3-deoxygalactonokinase